MSETNRSAAGFTPFVQAVGLVVAILICFAAAGLGSLVTTPQIPNWYADLAKPAWTPPGWIFGPVWTVLYILMGVAAWRIWYRFRWRGARVPLTLFGIQLVLNALWTPAFFGLQSPLLGLVVILLLWAVLTATTIAYGRSDRPAGLMLLPYLAWVSFATILNFELWRLNSGS